MMVEEYGKYVQILAYRLHKDIDPKTFIEAMRAVSRPVTVQFFDTNILAGHNHLFFATSNAIKSFTQGQNLAQTLDIEILLYVSTQRQIGEAIQMVGLKPQTSTIAVVLVGENEEEVGSAIRRLESIVPGDRDHLVLDRIDKEKFSRLMKVYGIGAPELEAVSTMSREEALQWLIVERGALLAARR